MDLIKGTIQDAEVAGEQLLADASRQVGDTLDKLEAMLRRMKIVITFEVKEKQ